MVVNEVGTPSQAVPASGGSQERFVKCGRQGRCAWKWRIRGPGRNGRAAQNKARTGARRPVRARVDLVTASAVGAAAVAATAAAVATAAATVAAAATAVAATAAATATAARF